MDELQAELQEDELRDEERGKERRRAERERLKGSVSLSWRAAGFENKCVGNSFDISDTGLLVEAPQCILVGTKTTLQINGETRVAIVRHCRKHGAWYRIGLQFKVEAAKATPATELRQSAISGIVQLQNSRET